MTSAATPLLRATIIAFTFFILELIAGWMSGSLAIVSDALSLFQSSVGFAVGWAAIHMAEWGPTRRKIHLASPKADSTAKPES
ncbi:hypothetical protein HDU79_003427 [Rhizoclosmatium sp. JEL0117]|nr:hypothetical protein HDU79_003427 [Rhizoclosmatium sp. JEL0117]